MKKWLVELELTSGGGTGRATAYIHHPPSDLGMQHSVLNTTVFDMLKVGNGLAYKESFLP